MKQEGQHCDTAGKAATCSHVWVLVCVLAVPSFLLKAWKEQWEDTPSTWAPITHMGDQEEVPAFGESQFYLS